MMEKLLCSKNNTLMDALGIINKNGKRAVFVIDERKKLCGVLTDGDVRRLLLSGHQLQEKVANSIRGNFVYAKDSQTYEQILPKFNDTIKIMPVVNSAREVVNYFQYEEDIHIPVVKPDLNGNELKYLVHAFLSTWISSRGIYKDIFEKEFAKFCSCKYGVSTSNGTVALHLALLALGIGKGDEVIVPDLTFAATINAVLHAGATPVIVDVEKDSWCIDPVQIRKVITRKTKAIIPVHLYGQPADMDAIASIARKRKLFIIEDCAEAHGATFDNRKVGSFGDIGCFSFFANKVITTGEGGMCVTNSRTLAKKMMILRDHGMSLYKKYRHEVVGYNYRMTNLQAAIGVAQLERVEEILSNRQRLEDEYKKNLSGIDFIEFQRDDLVKRNKIVWLVSFLIKNKKRDLYIQRLLKKGIDVRPFFYPLSKMKLYKKYVFSAKNSVDISRAGISFPTICSSVYKGIFDHIKNILHN